MTEKAKVGRLLRSGELARLTGVSTDTLRHYERKGLLPAPRRATNGYRQYGVEAVGRVRLVRAALAVGFTLDELAGILGARDRGGVSCRKVRALTAERLEEIEARLRELHTMREYLRGVLDDWDARLAATPEHEPARLLESLADDLAGTSAGDPPAHFRRRMHP